MISILFETEIVSGVTDNFDTSIKASFRESQHRFPICLQISNRQNRQGFHEFDSDSVLHSRIDRFGNRRINATLSSFFTPKILIRKYQRLSDEMSFIQINGNHLFISIRTYSLIELYIYLCPDRFSQVRLQVRPFSAASLVPRSGRTFLVVRAQYRCIAENRYNYITSPGESKGEGNFRCFFFTGFDAIFNERVGDVHYERSRARGITTNNEIKKSNFPFEKRMGEHYGGFFFSPDDLGPYLVNPCRRYVSCTIYDIISCDIVCYLFIYFYFFVAHVRPYIPVRVRWPRARARAPPEDSDLIRNDLTQ